MKRISITHIFLALPLFLLDVSCQLLAHESCNLVLHAQTDHFRAYGSSHDKDSVLQMLAALESKYADITGQLHAGRDLPLIDIEVYEEFEHLQMHYPDIQDPFMSCAVYTGTRQAVMLLSPRCFPKSLQRDQIERSPVYGFTRILLKIDYGEYNPPRWLCEGIPLYYEGPGLSAFFVKDLCEFASDRQLPSIEALEMGDGFRALYGHACAYTLVKFIQAKWGSEALVQLLKDYQNFEGILGLSKKDFQWEWESFVRTTYFAG